MCVETEAMEYNLLQVSKLANDKMNFIDWKSNIRIFKLSQLKSLN